MKIIIFAGGSGRRLWPLSRQKSPKQFEPIIGEKSTLQLAVDRVLDTYGAENIFISTNHKYVDLVRQQLPQLGLAQIIGEPTRRDLAAAVGLAMTHVARVVAPHEPVAILWGDNYMNQVANFLQVISTAEHLIEQKKAQIVFVGETPRFANDNLGWIGLGPKAGEFEGQPYHHFESLTYRPALALCQQMFAQKTHVWNTGYFVTTVPFIQEAYQAHQPAMWAGLSEIASCIGQAHYGAVLDRIYPQLASLSFDDAILHYLKPAQALVLHQEMGWSDPGTLYALKEAINPGKTENVTKGLVIQSQSEDCLLYNFEPHKLLAVVGLAGMVVVNTPDALLVVHKDHIPLVKQMINGLEGTELESYS